MVIYKYTLDRVARFQTLRIPFGKNTKLLGVQEQDDRMVLWAIVNTDDRERELMIGIYYTGVDVPHNILEDEYLGTVQMANGIVYHCFSYWL